MPNRVCESFVWFLAAAALWSDDMDRDGILDMLMRHLGHAVRCLMQSWWAGALQHFIRDQLEGFERLALRGTVGSPVRSKLHTGHGSLEVLGP